MQESYRLRRGRLSLENAYYLITITTQNRYPAFTSFQAACCASRCFYQPRVQELATTISFVVMPDHVHWLIQLNERLPEAVRRYKSYVSLGLGESAWQRGFHDRMIRQEESLRDVARYIVGNPLRANLVQDINHYSYWDAVWL
ncbi:MAG: REP-associated tyrosine transposase [Halomonadaceae bacterium]|uniref:Transposase n=1 Tax=Halomonas colorata TaxID=2742615 RepID=A0ABR9G305_9GAMM|nr:transposase [Halomonas colorata]MBE0465297.1 transposase [Halomonas colorata]